MPRPTFRVPLRQSSGQPRTARSLSALGIELHGLASIRKLWRWLKLAHFFAFSPISNSAGLSRLNITASALSIAGAVAGASVARFVRKVHVSF
jgi:hypothetical protein